MMVNKVSPMKKVLDQSYPQFVDERRILKTLFKSFEAIQTRSPYAHL